jgi:hypothetical protein
VTRIVEMGAVIQVEWCLATGMMQVEMIALMICLMGWGQMNESVGDDVHVGGQV